MTRPSRAEMIRRFFHELGQTTPGGETEAAIEVNTRACEAILADQIKLFDECHSKQGDGALVIQLARGEAYYVTLEAFCQDLIAAEEAGDPSTATFLKEVIRSVKTTDFSGFILVMLVDKSRTSLLPVPREYPAGGIKELQEQSVV